MHILFELWKQSGKRGKKDCLWGGGRREGKGLETAMFPNLAALSYLHVEL